MNNSAQPKNMKKTRRLSKNKVHLKKKKNKTPINILKRLF